MGGGLFIYASSSTVSNNIFVGNSSSCGGGVWFTGYVDFVLRGNEFIRNTATDGGGIYFDMWGGVGYANFVISENILTENLAMYGGGIHIALNQLMTQEFPAPLISNNILVGNISSKRGGGIYCLRMKDDLNPSNPFYITIRNCTLVENDAGEFGGGMCFSSVSGLGHEVYATIENTLVAYNDGGGIECAGDVEPLLNCCDIFSNVNGAYPCGIDGGGNFSLDPKFCGMFGMGEYYLQPISPCAPANNSCGQLIGALPVGCSTVSLVHCPGDTVIPSFSTVPTLVLKGFKIANIDTIDLAFNYYLTAEGPVTLVDNWDSTSLSGTTPIIAPGTFFNPPQAALDVPEIREPVQEFITYHVTAVGHPIITDSCTTVITFEPPVAIQISNFEGEACGSQVELVWEIESDEEITGFNVFRTDTDGSNSRLLNFDGLISKEQRQYIDNDIQSGSIYKYTLSVVCKDGFQIQSQTISIKTRMPALALYQNYPNPFKKNTSIKFNLPEEMSVELTIYDIAGRRIKTLVRGMKEPGVHDVPFDASGIASGVYFYKLKAGDRTITKKLVIMK